MANRPDTGPNPLHFPPGPPQRKPFSDIRVMLLERIGEHVAPRAIRYEVKRAGRRRIEDSFD